ncbi:hypothetical protein C8R44DRAFT_978093 [Mycena epipterygia]|nr:hypothetical protein C8R44DRAFT_978093 [Mycena epipterygia]
MSSEDPGEPASAGDLNTVWKKERRAQTREHYLPEVRSPPSSAPRTTDADCPPAHPPTHGFAGRPLRLACSRCLLVPPASSGLVQSFPPPARSCPTAVPVLRRLAMHPHCTLRASAPHRCLPTAADLAHVRCAAAADTALPPAVAVVAFGAHTTLPSPSVSPALCASAPLAWSDTVLRPIKYGSRTPYLSFAPTHVSTTMVPSLHQRIDHLPYQAADHAHLQGRMCAAVLPNHSLPSSSSRRLSVYATPCHCARRSSRSRVSSGDMKDPVEGEGRDGGVCCPLPVAQSPAAPSSHSLFDGRRSEDVSTTHAGCSSRAILIVEPAWRMGHASGARMALRNAFLLRGPPECGNHDLILVQALVPAALPDPRAHAACTLPSPLIPSTPASPFS